MPFASNRVQGGQIGRIAPNQLFVFLNCTKYVLGYILGEKRLVILPSLEHGYYIG
jgi:hypothetical protein